MSNTMAWYMVLVIISITILNSSQESNAAEVGDKLSRVKRVIGGEDIEKGKWPWLVSIKGDVKMPGGWWFFTNTRTFWCGGSLLNGRWVLTAAHCVSPRENRYAYKAPRQFHVRAGETDRTASFSGWFKHWIGRMFGKISWRAHLHASKIIIHPGYNPNKLWLNDIALIKLEGDLVAKAGASPVRLPTVSQSFPADGQQCFFKGWGCHYAGGKLQNLAKQVVLPKVSDQTCQSIYRVDSSKQLCAGKTLANIGICSGDSGGPLVCKQGGDWVQAGVASFTAVNKPGQYPGAFSRVTAYKDWIEKMIKEN